MTQTLQTIQILVFADGIVLDAEQLTDKIDREEAEWWSRLELASWFETQREK